MMDGKTFVRELKEEIQARLERIGAVSSLAGEAERQVDLVSLLKMALANEISVSELAAVWMPSTPEWDVKLALAQQAGDEARHFKIIENRLGELNVSVDDFAAPKPNKLLDYLRGLSDTVQRIAAGQFALEALAYKVNDDFLRYAELSGDHVTAKIYRNMIQPDELFHHELGSKLLEKYAATPEAQRRAREAALRTLEIASELRAAAVLKIGAACFPGC